MVVMISTKSWYHQKERKGIRKGIILLPGDSWLWTALPTWHLHPSWMPPKIILHSGTHISWWVMSYYWYYWFTDTTSLLLLLTFHLFIFCFPSKMEILEIRNLQAQWLRTWVLKSHIETACNLWIYTTSPPRVIEPQFLASMEPPGMVTSFPHLPCSLCGHTSQFEAPGHMEDAPWQLQETFLNSQLHVPLGPSLATDKAMRNHEDEVWSGEERHVSSQGLWHHGLPKHLGTASQSKDGHLPWINFLYCRYFCFSYRKMDPNVNEHIITQAWVQHPPQSPSSWIISGRSPAPVRSHIKWDQPDLELLWDGHLLTITCNCECSVVSNSGWPHGL